MEVSEEVRSKILGAMPLGCLSCRNFILDGNAANGSAEEVCIMLNRDSPVPLYFQIQRRLEQAILSGQYPVGDAIPPEQELVDRFQVSRGTIQKAMAALEADGLIARYPGKGTFVINKEKRVVRDFAYFGFESGVELQEPFTVEVLKFERIPPAAFAISRLRIVPSHEVTLIKRLVSDEAGPLWYEVRYLAVDFPKELASHMSIAEALEKQGIRIAELESEISASGASKIHSSLLQIPLGSPVLLSEYVSFTDTGSRIQTGRTIFRADKYKFRVTSVRKPK
jgi:GntR family transcriptional regulator